MTRPRRTDANFAPLSPLGFLPRSASIYPDRVAVVHGERRIVYRDFDRRARRLASALARRGIGPGDTVSAVLPNVPAMLEAHFGVPMTGAVLNTINTRLDARTIAYILEHGEAKVLLTDREYAGTVGPALERVRAKPLIVEVDDALYQGPGDRLGEIEYEALLATRPDGVAGDAAGRRERAARAQLHLGNHRQSQGRRLSPPRRLPGIGRQRHDVAAAAARGLSLDSADVPLQRLVLHVGGDGDGRHARVPAPRRSTVGVPADCARARHPHVRRADRADAVDPDSARPAGGVSAGGRARDRRLPAAGPGHPPHAA